MQHRSKLLFGAAVLTAALVAVPTIAIASSDSHPAPPASPVSMGIFVPDHAASSADPSRHGFSGVTPDVKFTWGWITGTVYFNRRETKLIAAYGGAAGYLASLLGPWGVLVGSHIGAITAVASYASSTGRCLKIKVPAITPGVYSGGYCT